MRIVIIHKYRRHTLEAKAFELLEKSVAIQDAQGLNELEEQGLIQRFEFTHDTYNKDIAVELKNKILHEYYLLFSAFRDTMLSHTTP